MNLVRVPFQFLILFGLLALTPLSHARHAAILIDSANGNVLYELEPNQAWYPASLTKLMTIYMTFEALESGRIRLDRHLNVSSHAARQPTSKLGLRPWETISVEDAIIAIVTRSANDAAVVLAEGISGSERQFAVRMTSTAHRIGMLGSHFMNATGLPHDWQTTTAHDMGLLAMRIIRDFPQYYSYFAADSLYFHGREWRSINKFVNYYPGAEGMKTGYTCGSGYNLVATANHYGKRLIGVVLGGMSSSERYEHMFMMMDMGFSNPNSGYRSKNINTMSKYPVGTPPYQLSCGHRPTSHYASNSDHDADDDANDDHRIHYVKKYKELPLLSGGRKKLDSEPKPSPRRIMPAPIRHSEPSRLAKSDHDARQHAVKGKHKEQPEKQSNHERVASSTKSTKAKAVKGEKNVKSAGTAKNKKGYYTPSAKPVKLAGSTKAKHYFKPDSPSKAPGKSKKSKVKS
jgi:D-alanyl-D-alanine carboxypeptidase